MNRLKFHKIMTFRTPFLAYLREFISRVLYTFDFTGKSTENASFHRKQGRCNIFCDFSEVEFLNFGIFL